MTTLAIPGMAYAEANWGRWVARCPAGLCTNAVQVNRWQQRYECVGAGGCGWTSYISWPPDPEAVETLLAMRPDPNTRSWVPGETLQDLLLENGQHGVLPPDWMNGTRVLLDTADDRATGGHLMDALPEYRRRAIGVC